MVAGILLLAFSLASAPYPLCSVGPIEGEDESAKKPIALTPKQEAEELVRGTPVIVRATAEREIPRRPGETLPRMVFRITEVLKGEQVPDTLVISGYVHDADDFNPRPVPYAYRREGALSGSCYAYSYRIGAEYLLLLARFDGDLSPYHSIFKPTNEQLRGPGDPWLRWVRAQLRADARTPAGSKASP